MFKLPWVSLALLVCGSSLIDGANKLQERFRWNQLDFEFPSEQMKEQALASGDYIPQNGLPVGVERYQNKLFVTVPRWRDGIPSTLNYLDLNTAETDNPQLIPYPSFAQNAVGDCANGLQTVYRIKADRCGRLWVLDTGTIGIGNTTRNVCPYAINIFDLRSNRRIRRYVLRPEDTNPNTFIANMAVDIGKSCEDTYAYMSDELGYGLISYSFEENKSFRFGHSYFFPDPLRGDYNIAGLNFQWGEEGIFGMALSPPKADGYRTMYFSPLASHREFAVSTKILRDETKIEEGYHDFQFLKERGPNSHTTSRVMDDNGLMFFNLIDQNAVGCWHSSLPYSPEYHDIVDKDDVGLVFPADVKIDDENTVWVMSDRMPVFLIAELDYSDINFRIYSAPLDALVEGTVCDLRTPSSIGNRFAANGIYSSLPTTEVSVQPKYVSAPISQIPQTTYKYNYNHPSANSHVVASHQQYPTTPKAYAFNSHNGVQFEAHTPHFHHDNYRPDHYQAGPKPSWWSRNIF